MQKLNQTEPTTRAETELREASRAVEMGGAMNTIMDKDLEPPSVQLIQELYNEKIVHPSRIASKSQLTNACKSLWVKVIGYQEKIGELKDLLKRAGKQMDAYKEAVETGNTRMQLLREQNEGMAEELDVMRNERHQLQAEIQQLRDVVRRG